MRLSQRVLQYQECDPAPEFAPVLGFEPRPRCPYRAASWSNHYWHTLDWLSVGASVAFLPNDWGVPLRIYAGSPGRSRSWHWDVMETLLPKLVD